MIYYGVTCCVAEIFDATGTTLARVGAIGAATGADA